MRAAVGLKFGLRFLDRRPALVEVLKKLLQTVYPFVQPGLDLLSLLQLLLRLLLAAR